MQLASVVLARVFALFEIGDLNPEGHVHYPDLVSALVERYAFAKFPSTPDQFDESKGITFEMGKWNDVVIEKTSILSGGLIVETANTDTAEAVLEDAMKWAAAEFRLTLRPEILKRRAFVSQVTFYSEAPILMMNPVLDRISARVTKEVAANLGLPLKYEPTAIAINIDKVMSQLTPAPFTIERREGVPFADKKYFSSAPLRTNLHMELLAEMEKVFAKS